MCPSSAKEHFWNWGRLCMKPHFQTETMNRKKVVQCGFYSKPGEALWFSQILTWRQRGLTVCGWVSFYLSCSIWFYFPDLKYEGQMTGTTWKHVLGIRWGADEDNFSFLGPCCPFWVSVCLLFSRYSFWEDLSNSKTLKIIFKGRELLTPYKNGKDDWTLVYASKPISKSVFVTQLLNL